MKKITKANAFKSIDHYIKNLPAEVKQSLEKLRQTIRKAAPEAEEVISYNMPGYKYQGMLVYFASFKNHCTFFTGNGSLVKKMEDELKGYATTPSGIHFTPDKPLPASLVKKIITIRMRENEARQLARMKRKESRK